MAAAVLAGIFAAMPMTGATTLASHTIMLAGDGASGACIAELIATAIAHHVRAIHSTLCLYLHHTQGACIAELITAGLRTTSEPPVHYASTFAAFSACAYIAELTGSLPGSSVSTEQRTNGSGLLEEKRVGFSRGGGGVQPDGMTDGHTDTAWG